MTAHDGRRIARDDGAKRGVTDNDGACDALDLASHRSSADIQAIHLFELLIAAIPQDPRNISRSEIIIQPAEGSDA
jgi:hypothetical protein